MALRKAATKTLEKRDPAIDIRAIKLKNLLQQPQKAFENPENGAHARLNIFHGNKNRAELLANFWNVLKEISANCKFGTETKADENRIVH